MSYGSKIQRQQTALLECRRPVIVEPSTPAVVGGLPAEANRSRAPETAATADALIGMALEPSRTRRKPRYDDSAQLTLSF
jgi:hypothetical protein